ncbi:Omega-6 fatty acid desaturase [Hibiscus syriacus]|uniref:Omega-6 fatty acid desaturase n=1 Tax=Hibiscus syriacus TaxID=106335 RepID=A0A6A2YCP2_HIBSY|nr:Omega-6 fatty acid desaturase [Hibiscus syriacus]
MACKILDSVFLCLGPCQRPIRSQRIATFFNSKYLSFEVFEIDDVKAWTSVLIYATSCALGIFMISKASWYLLPLVWAWTGTTVTGVSRSRVQGAVDRSRSRPNVDLELQEDTAWHPVWKEEFEGSPFLRKAIMFSFGPFRPWMSIAHWNFRPNEVKRVKMSLACVFAFMAVGWPLIIYKTEIMGWIKFWIMPWLGYHFWAQLTGTVHCDYPHWIEILCLDISVHIPHHVSSRIPSYNLRAAHRSIQEN